MAKLKTGRHTSAIKELRKSKKRHLRNISTKSAIKTQIKKLEKSVLSKNATEAKLILKGIFSSLDKAAGKKIINKNTASRKKSRLSKKIVKLEKQPQSN